MNFIQRWLYIRKEEKKDRERALNNSWIEEYSEEMQQIIKGEVIDE